MYQNFIIPCFTWSSTCFGRHTAHHQEPKTALAASGFAYVEGCWTLSGSVYATWQRPTTACPTTFHVCKFRGWLCSFRLLMMSGVSPETCWASCNIRNTKILLHCRIFLGFSLQELCYDAWIHEHQDHKKLFLLLADRRKNTYWNDTKPSLCAIWRCMWEWMDGSTHY